MVIRISDKTQNYSKVTKLLVKPIYKCLKKYRNTVAHALRENGESVSREVIEKWIELYIILLNRFLKNVVPICAEANNRRRNQQNNSRRNRQNNQREN